MPTNKKTKKPRPRKPAREKQERKNKVSADKTFGSKGAEFESFLVQMIQWFHDHEQEVEEHLSLKDRDRSGSVNLKDFELVLLNVGAPCGQDQLHVLTEQLKTNNDMIKYQDVNQQLERLRLGNDAGTSEDVSGLTGCTGRMLNPHKERFIHLSVRLIPFHFSAKHPANFEVMLSSGCRVYSLIRIIRDRVGIQTSGLEVFRSGAAAEETRLPPENSLEECGFRAGAEETVFYDYTLMLTDCPVLNCDHYFSCTPDSAAGQPGTTHQTKQPPGSDKQLRLSKVHVLEASFPPSDKIKLITNNNNNNNTK